MRPFIYTVAHFLHRPCARYIYTYEDDSGRQRFVCQNHDWEMPRNCVVS